MKGFLRAVAAMLCMLAASSAHAQVQTGSIAGVVTDTSNAIMASPPSTPASIPLSRHGTACLGSNQMILPCTTFPCTLGTLLY